MKWDTVQDKLAVHSIIDHAKKFDLHTLEGQQQYIEDKKKRVERLVLQRLKKEGPKDPMRWLRKYRKS